MSATDDAAATPPRWVTTAWELRAEHAETDASSGAGLSAAKIVAAGIELADDDGLAALSIRKLAARLGAGTMATYRHVDSREHLVILMVDTALGAPPAEIIQTDAWHDRVRRWAIAISARYAAHPWLVDAPVAGFTATPHRALWLEYILQSLQPSGLNTRQMLDAALLIDGHARNVSALTRAVEADGEPHEGAADAAPAWLAALLPSDEYPMLSRVLSLDVFDEDSARDLEFGLGRIIDGIEALAVGEHAATVQRGSDTLTAP
jgi:AcrR family transcriptional regulator